MSLYSFENQIIKLKEAMTEGLPGSLAHSRMAPAHRDRLISFSRGPEFARKSGVLILLFPDDHNEINTVFIKRMEYDGVHSGQTAFPGGKYEESDPDIIATAVREAEEEIGIERDAITIVGQLSELFVPPSNFIISPVVASTPYKPAFNPDKTEVSEIFTLPLRYFMLPEHSGEFELKTGNNQTIHVPGYIHKHYLIWGATAMILSELLYVYAGSDAGLTNN